MNLKRNKDWKKAVLERDAGLCQRCLSQYKFIPAVDAHHIIHKSQGDYVRYLVDNGVSLCRECHDLDSQGKLLPWCIEWLGEDKYYEIKRKNHESI